MFRIIRSARSRLSREQSVDVESREDKDAASRSSVPSTQAPRRSSLPRSAFGRSRLSRNSAAGTSENAAPEKLQQPPIPSGKILNDVTNITVVPSGGMGLPSD